MNKIKKDMTKTKFLDPEKLLLEAGLKPGMAVADLGSGHGFFTIPASRIVGDSGKVWAVDILEETLSKIMSLARLSRLNNIRTLRHDLESPAQARHIESLSCDFVIIGKVLPQLKSADGIIREAYRMLKTGGAVLMIEWKKERSKLGPAYETRLEPEDVKRLFCDQGFKYVSEFQPDIYHYALLLQK